MADQESLIARARGYGVVRPCLHQCVAFGGKPATDFDDIKRRGGFPANVSTALAQSGVSHVMRVEGGISANCWSLTLCNVSGVGKISIMPSAWDEPCNVTVRWSPLPLTVASGAAFSAMPASPHIAAPEQGKPRDT